MKIFMTGATGYIGSVIAERLQQDGHEITALARSDQAAQQLAEHRITAIAGSVTSHDVLRAAAKAADAVIYAAVEFTPQGFEAEYAAVTTLLEALADTGKPLIFTSGVGVLGNSAKQVLDEYSPYAPWPLVARRTATEQAVIAAAERGVRSAVLRPGMVYGRRGGSGVGLYTQGAARLGVAPYLGNGETHWPVVHVDDLADLFLLVLTAAPAGAIVHGVRAETIRFRQIAEATAQGLQLPDSTVSWSVEQLQEAFGPAGAVFAVDQRIALSRAEAQLGWRSSRPGLLEELQHGSYAVIPA